MKENITEQEIRYSCKDTAYYNVMIRYPEKNMYVYTVGKSHIIPLNLEECLHNSIILNARTNPAIKTAPTLYDFTIMCSGVLLADWQGGNIEGAAEFLLLCQYS